MARTKATIRRGIAERNALAEKNLGLAHHVANGFFSVCDDRFDDAKQDGRIGLLYAAATFDETRPSTVKDPLAVYASRCIRQEIWDALRDRGNLIHVPRHAFGLLAKHDLKGRKAASCASARRALACGEMPEDFVCDDQPEFGNRYLFVDLHEAMNELPLRERWLIHAYYWKKLRLTDLSARLGVTRWTATRMLETVVGKLRQTLEAA